MKKFIIIAITALFFNSSFYINLSYYTVAYDYTNKNEGKVVESAKVDTSIPSWFKPMETDNLNEWLNILPDYLQKYRSADQFMVIPAMGLITPIVELETNNPDYKLAMKGGDFDYNKYLISGPTIYPGTAPVGEPGNSFIFAHSNYWIDKPGDFKTIFRLTYNVEEGDIIRYYKKEKNTRTQYTFTVTKSMLVNETDIWVMLPTKGKTEITLSACRPIGTAKQRWINRAELSSKKIIDYKITESKTNRPINQNNAEKISESDSLGAGSGINSGNGGSIMEYKPKQVDVLAQKAFELAIEIAQSLHIQ